MTTVSCFISEPRLSLTLSGAECFTLSIQINITFLLEYLVDAINCTMFFTMSGFGLGFCNLVRKRPYILFKQHTISRSNMYSLSEVMSGSKV